MKEINKIAILLQKKLKNLFTINKSYFAICDHLTLFLVYD